MGKDKRPDQLIRDLQEKVEGKKKKNKAKLEWDTLEELFVTVQEVIIEERGIPEENKKYMNRGYEMLISMLGMCIFIAGCMTKKKRKKSSK